MRSPSAKILIVEHDPTMREFLVHLLSPHHRVVTARNSWEALDRLLHEYCEVALIDLDLPGLKGDWLAEQVRRMDISTVTVLIAGQEIDPADPELETSDLWIQKPFSQLNQLECTVDQAVEMHRLWAAAAPTGGGMRWTDKEGEKRWALSEPVSGPPV